MIILGRHIGAEGPTESKSLKDKVQTIQRKAISLRDPSRRLPIFPFSPSLPPLSPLRLLSLLAKNGPQALHAAQHPVRRVTHIGHKGQLVVEDEEGGAERR